MMIKALLRPVWEVVTYVFTSFVHGPANNVQHLDAFPRGHSAWNKTADKIIDLSRSKEHHRVAFSQLAHSHTACSLVSFYPQAADALTLYQSILSNLGAKCNGCAHSMGKLEIGSPRVGVVEVYHALFQLPVERR